jgi:hypothetical protein
MTVEIHSNYHQMAGQTVSRMQAENRKENARIRPRTLRRMMMHQLQVGDPNASIDDLEKLVDQLLPSVMARYNGPPALVHEKTQTAGQVYDVERRRIVKSNKLRRKMEQPLSRSDRKWIVRGK